MKKSFSILLSLLFVNSIGAMDDNVNGSVKLLREEPVTSSEELIKELQSKQNNPEEQILQMRMLIEGAGERAKEKTISALLSDGKVLHEALVASKNVDLVKYLIQMHANLQYTDDFNKTNEERAITLDVNLKKTITFLPLYDLVSQTTWVAHRGRSLNVLAQYLKEKQLEINGEADRNVPFTDEDIVSILEKKYAVDDRARVLDGDLIDEYDRQEDKVESNVPLPRASRTHLLEKNSFDLKSFAAGGAVATVVLFALLTFKQSSAN